MTIKGRTRLNTSLKVTNAGLFFALICAITAPWQGAQAVPVSVGFAGTVDLLSDPSGQFPGAEVFLGAAFSGIVLYEDSTAASSAAPGLSAYPAIQAFSVTFGTTSYTSELIQTAPPEPANQILIGNDRGSCGCEDMWKATAFGDQDSFPGLTGTMTLSLLDDTPGQDPLSSTALAGQTPGAATDWRQPRFLLSVAEILTFPDGSFAGFLTKATLGGALDALDTRIDVPEPSSLALFGLGLASLAVTRRRKQPGPRKP